MPILVSACPVCDRQLTKSSGFTPSYWCNNCGKGFMRSQVETRTKYRNTNKERSDIHEKKAAKKVKGRRTVASGSVASDKGDVKTSDLRMECKTTQKLSYSLKQELLLKIRKETKSGQMPVFNIQFEREDGNLNYYVIDEGWFLELLDLWRKNNEQQQ